MTSPFSKAKIYAILDSQGQHIYIGSTQQRLCERKRGHRQDYIRHPHIRLYKHITDNGGWNDFRFEVIEDYPCETKKELLQREGHYIRELKPLCNQLIAGAGSGSEWKINNRERYNAHQREYLREYRAKKRALAPSNT
jgi:hypothetical protein